MSEAVRETARGAMGGVRMELDGFGRKRTREIAVGTEDGTQELEISAAGAPYIGERTNPGEDVPSVELVNDEAFLVPEPMPVRANPVSAYLAGLAESSRRPMRTNLETIARLVSGNRVSAMELAW
ncbi:MAG: hypothetical protein H0U55_03925 [Rubrobacteraceae bacterium]|nr:hypothetical protein [Rubrobacteraceae bacterium]